MRGIFVGALLVAAALLFWWAGGRGGEGRRAARPPERARPDAAETADPAPVEPDQETEHAADAAEEISIRVIDEEGAPIAGAWIEVRRSELEGVRGTGRTDGLGFATVRVTRNDMLFVGARGFMRTYVTSPLRRATEDVVLERSYGIAGVVVDGTGAGIAGAALSLKEPFLPERTATSGPDGRFEFEDVCDQEMQLGVDAKGFAGGGCTVTPGDADVRIVLWKPLTVSGVVVFPDGSPASGAKVGKRTADGGGRFTLDEVVPGRLELWASLETEDRRWAAKSVVEIAADGTHAPIRLVLEPKPLSWVRVRAVDVDGSPVAGVGILGPMIGLPFPTDAEGRRLCTFEYAPGTATTVEVHQTRSDGLLPGRAEVVTGARDGAEVVLRPREPLLVTVVARGPEGEPLPPGVNARFETYGNRVVRRERDSVIVAVDPMAPAFGFTVGAPGFASRYLQLALPPDGYTEVRLSGTAAVICRLVDETGAAVPDGSVRAWVPRLGSGDGSEAQPDGSYRIDAVPVGRALVTAGYDDDLPLVRTEVDVSAGETIDLGTLVLRSPRVLSGRVTDTSDRPVGGAQVCAVEGDSDARTFSRSDGSFRLVVSPWFGGHVLASKPGHGSAHRRAAENLELVLPPEGRVHLEVRFPQPQRSGGWSFAVRDPSTGLRWPVDRQKIEGTTYLVKGLPPGRLILIVRTLPKDGEAEVVVVAGETVPAVVQVPE